MELIKLWIYETNWLWSGIAHALVLIVIGKVLIYSYREHAYLYQLHDSRKTFDAWIKVLLPVARVVARPSYLRNLELKLSRAAVRRDWDGHHFIATQILCGVSMFFVSFILINLLWQKSWLWTLLLTALFAWLPYVKLSDMARIRTKACQRDLPFYIDYLALAASAGMDVQRSLLIVVRDAPASPLKEEFAQVLSNTHFGMTLSEALEEMQVRLDLPSVRQFVQTVVQGIELGNDLLRTLSVMSETLQQRRFQQAEEMAGKISVRMMVPMMCFVMPSVMIILLGPMVLSFFSAN